MHNEKFQNLYSAAHIIRMIWSMWMKLVEHVACLKSLLNSYRALVGTLDGKQTLSALGIGGDCNEIIVQETDYQRSSVAQDEYCYEHSNERWISLKVD
jgi:hypothetical protein